MVKYTILQIMPASGWSAIWWPDSTDPPDTKPRVEPLVGWALVRREYHDGPAREVEAIVSCDYGNGIMQLASEPLLEVIRTGKSLGDPTRLPGPTVCPTADVQGILEDGYCAPRPDSS